MGLPKIRGLNTQFPIGTNTEKHYETGKVAADVLFYANQAATVL